jgi:hypothetical protein
MKRRILLMASLVLVFVAAAMPLAGQSLLDNEFYHSAQDLLAQCQKSLDQGDYDAATSFASQARDSLSKSDDYVATMLQFYRANGYLSVAKDRVTYAKSIDADVNYKDAYTTAVSDVTDAKTALDGKDYPKSIDLSKSAIAALKDIAPVVAKTPTQPVAPVSQPAPAAQPSTPSLPQYYVVQLKLPLRDCFWRIAAYPFVYNDPWKWKLIYDANKSLLADAGNPDIIEPGMRFIIPPVNGETREGDYDPSVSYPALPNK